MNEKKLMERGDRKATVECIMANDERLGENRNFLARRSLEEGRDLTLLAANGLMEVMMDIQLAKHKQQERLKRFCLMNAIVLRPNCSQWKEKYKEMAILHEHWERKHIMEHWFQCES